MGTRCYILSLRAVTCDTQIDGPFSFPGATMELSATLYTALNAQFNAESANAREYHALANRFETLCLSGFAARMRRQADGEDGHAAKVRDFLIGRNKEPGVDALPAMGVIGADVEALLQAAYSIELRTTAQWDAISAAAIAAGDPATIGLALWFAAEQVEEERDATEWLNRAVFADGNPAALLILDKQAEVE